MRLLTVGSLPPEWGGPLRGGAATFHAALLIELTRRDEVEIVGILPPGPLNRGTALPAFPRPEGVSHAQHYEELLERLRPDVVLMNHFAHTVGVTHARLGSPIPAIGVAQSWHNITFSTPAQRNNALGLTQEALDGLGAVVTVSRRTAEEGEQLGLTYPGAAETIHNPVPLLFIDDFNVTIWRRSGVVFLGSLIPRKRPDALLEAAGLLPDLRLALIGEGNLEADLRARIGALGIGGRVRLSARHPGDGHPLWLREALRRALAVCLPSSSEGLPLAFLEALACGTPVVGFGPAVREIRDELGISIGEPVEGGDPEEIATAIERVLSTEWDRNQLRDATLDHFGLDRVTDRYLDLFARSVGEPTREQPITESGRRPSPRRFSPRPVGVPVCVLGPSRSGTSLTARLLSLAGVYLGSEADLLGEDRHQLVGEGEKVMAKARRSNPDGHWEHYRLMRLNERILHSLGGSWRDPPPLPPGWERAGELDELREEARTILAESFDGRELWGWKDPRNSLTLPFWQGLLPGARYVICLRQPFEAAESLRRRDGIGLEAGVAGWMRYLSAALVNTAGRRRLLVDYRDYFRDPLGVAARLARFVGREGVFDEATGERRLRAAIDEGLWRVRAEEDGHPTITRATALFRVAELLVGSEDGEGPEEDRIGLHSAADRYAAAILSRSRRLEPSPVS